MPIDPITDSYIDGIVKANTVSDPSSTTTQGVSLRELVKLLRDRSEQELADGVTNLATETTARTTADTNLQNQLNALEPLTAANIETALGFTPANDTAVVHSALIGAAGGVTPLDGSAKVPAAYLPSYVDDVLEFANFAALPATGESGKIYVTLDTNFEYRWSGTVYIQLVASPGTTDALAEGTVNLYFTLARVLAATLPGISFSTAAAVVSTDTILQALGKLQAQFNSNATLLAPLASPAFTGSPTAPTPAAGDSSAKIATTAFVAAAAATSKISYNFYQTVL